MILAQLGVPSKLSQRSLTVVASSCWSNVVEVVHLDPFTTVAGFVRPPIPTTCSITTSCGADPTNWRSLNVPVAFSVRFFVADVCDMSNPSAKCSFGIPRSPSPASTSSNGQMVHTEAQPCSCYAQDCASNDVEAVMIEIRVPRGSYVNGEANRDEREDE